MIYLAAALYAEAKPFIRALGLKSRDTRHRFQLFTSDTHTLIITGTGSLAAAIADTWLLTRCLETDEKLADTAENDCFAQIGCAGCLTPSYPVGSLYLCHQITDARTKHSVYPDMLYRSDFAEARLVTYSTVQTEQMIQIEQNIQTGRSIPDKQRIPIERKIPDEQKILAEQNIPVEQRIPAERKILAEQRIPAEQNIQVEQRIPAGQNVRTEQNEQVEELILPANTNFQKIQIASRNLTPVLMDMEGYGGYQAAAAFLPSHRIFTWKVLSDYGNTASLTPPDISSLLSPHVDSILTWMEAISETAFHFPKSDFPALWAMADAFGYSAAQRQRLHQLLRYAALTGQTEEDFLQYSSISPVVSVHPAQKKQEGKRILHELERQIIP